MSYRLHMTTTQQLKAVGMNDEQTECDACGRVELRGTVIVADEDGNEVGRYGTTCASRIVGEKVTRTQVNTVELSRRQNVVNTIKMARRATTDGDKAWWLKELRKFYVLHREDEKRVMNELIDALAPEWRVLFTEGDW